MPGLPFLLTRLDDDFPDRNAISLRLRKHLMRLRGHDIDDGTVETWKAATEAISEKDLDRTRTIASGSRRGDNDPELINGVPDRRPDRGQHDRIVMRYDDSLNGAHLDRVGHGRRPVSVHVVNIGPREPRLGERRHVSSTLQAGGVISPISVTNTCRMLHCALVPS